MKTPKKVLLFYNNELRKLPTIKLEEILKSKESELSLLKDSYDIDSDNYAYYSYPVIQKITLIKKELEKREAITNI